MTETEEKIADVMVASSLLPEYSCVHDQAVWENRILIRPFTPEGKTESGLWVTKNSKWARIWGWVLAVPERTLSEYPELRPGVVVVYKRYAEEIIGWDAPLNHGHLENYFGEKLPVAVIHEDSIEAVFDPPLIPLQV